MVALGGAVVKHGQGARTVRKREVETLTEAIVWGVLWFLFAFGGAWAIYAIAAFGGVGIAAATNKVWPAPVLIVLGWVAAIAWFIFAAVQVVLQIISVVQLASAG